MAHSTILINRVTDFDGGGALTDDAKLFIQQLDAPLTQNSDASGHDLYSVDVLPAVTQNIGTEGSPFYVNVSNTATTSNPPPYMLIRSTSGTSFIRPGASGIDNMFIDTGGAVKLVTDGTVAIMGIKRGTLSVATGNAITTGYQFGGSVEVFDSGSTDPTTYRQRGGRLWTQRGFGSYYNSGGYATIDAGSNTITLLDMSGNGTVDLIRSGTITTANLLGGTLDPDKIAQLVTITNCTIDVSLPWADDFLNSNLITFTNPPVIIGK